MCMHSDEGNVIHGRFPFDEKCWFEFPEFSSYESNSIYQNYQKKRATSLRLPKFLRISFRKTIPVPCDFPTISREMVHLTEIQQLSDLETFPKNFLTMCVCCKICRIFLLNGKHPVFYRRNYIINGDILSFMVFVYFFRY